MVIDKTLLDDIWGKIGPQQNRTKCPLHRIENLFNKCSEVIELGLEGDFLEAGVWKGGCSALMAKLCEIEGANRKTWSLDSFEGMSEPNLEFDLLEGESKAWACLQESVQLRNFNLEDFHHTCFDIMQVKEEYLNIVPGWVNDTIYETARQIDKIAVLRVDIDYYEPTKLILEHLYDKVVPGGYIICDDYGAWKGARKAIDDFRQARNLSGIMQQTYKTDDLKVGTEWFWQVS